MSKEEVVEEFKLEKLEAEEKSYTSTLEKEKKVL